MAACCAVAPDFSHITVRPAYEVRGECSGRTTAVYLSLEGQGFTGETARGWSLLGNQGAGLFSVPLSLAKYHLIPHCETELAVFGAIHIMGHFPEQGARLLFRQAGHAD